jgi:hypothetical protein
MQVLAVWACIGFFFVHFNGFAVQETITTPLVQDWYGWDELQVRARVRVIVKVRLRRAGDHHHAARARLVRAGRAAGVLSGVRIGLG